MHQATPRLRDAARRLLALEANGTERDATEAALSALGKIRSHLSKLVGITGFQVLLERALTMTKAEAGWLTSVRVQSDATLEGFGEAAQNQSDDVTLEGSVALLAQLLRLLIAFIGENLTVGIVRDVWPDSQAADGDFGAEETPE